MTLTFGSLFAGIGGIDLGLERAGMVCKWQVEIDPFCQKVLKKHWPDVARYEDVREVGKHNLEPVDLICGGFPCQDVSLAGERLGLEGKRSSLWSEYARIVGEVRPKWVLVENVTGLLSANDGEFFKRIQREFSALGYDDEWDTLPASAFGAVHQRERVFIVAHANRSGLAQRGNVFGKLKTPDGRAQEVKPAVRPPYLAISQYLANARNWPSQSIFLRANHGVSNRVDRVRSLGNAVVPQVAEWIGRRILEAV